MFIDYNGDYNICYIDKLWMQNAPQECMRTLVCKPQFRNISAGCNFEVMYDDNFDKNKIHAGT